MSTTFFINEMFTVSQNVQLYSQNVAVTNASTYDYVLEVDITAGSWNSMNHLFATRSVIQNSAIENTNGENTYDVNLTLNVDATRNLLFGSDAIGIKSDMSNVTNKNAYVTLLPSKKLIGLRLLEVLATKIFGHAQARSAISNDSAFYSNGSNSLIAQIASGINNGLVAKRNNIFNEYVQTGRIVTQANTANNGSSELVNGDDVQDNETMNFHSSNWEFPVTLNGSLLSAANANDLSVLSNGPDVGGNRLVNGMYSVPLLVRFYSSGAAAASVPAGTPISIYQGEYNNWLSFDGTVTINAFVYPALNFTGTLTLNVRTNGDWNSEPLSPNGGTIIINQQFTPNTLVNAVVVCYSLNGVGIYYSDIIAMGATAPNMGTIYYTQ